MSYTTIVHVYPGEKIENGVELKNSWGSAPYIWDVLYLKYIDHDGFWMANGNTKKLWPLWKRMDIPEHHRAVLMMTYDRAYVAKASYKRAAEDIRAFLRDFPSPDNHENHWPKIAEIFEGNPSYPAVGFWHTSVSENPFNGDWDEEKEEYMPPNWNECYEIYDKLDGLEAVKEQPHD